MRVFFIGTVELSLDILKQLLTFDYIEIVGVATRSTSVVNADFADLQPLCKQHNIPFKLVRDINHPNNVAFIKDTIPDVIYCFGWSNLIKKDILDIARLGVIGYHPATLPFNRGRHPIIWALALGLKKTGSSFFFMDEGADTGDILSQEEVLISQQDTAATLYKKITDIAMAQIKTFTYQLANGAYKRIPQPANTGNNWRKRGMSDGRIDFRMNSQTIYNLVRALTKPYVGAHIERNGENINVWSAIVGEDNQENIEFGKVLEIRGREIKVKTADGAVWLTEHDFITLPLKGEYL